MFKIETYIEKPPTVAVIYFKGGKKNGLAIVRWLARDAVLPYRLLAEYVYSSYDGEYIKLTPCISPNVEPVHLVPGCYLIIKSDGQIDIVDEVELDNRYEKVYEGD